MTLTRPLALARALTCAALAPTALAPTALAPTALAEPRGGAGQGEAEGRAPEVAVSLKGVTLEGLARLKSPAIVDTSALIRQLEQSLSGLEALTHMSKMVEENAQRALSAQIALVRATLEATRAGLASAARVDYAVPPLPPVVTRDAQGAPITAEATPMTAVRLSQRWSALEAAAFREEKMAIIREVARDEHLKVSQAEVLVGSLAFSADRQEAIIALYPKLVDPSQVEVLYGLLDHDSHRRKVEVEVKRLNMQRRERGR